MCWILFFIFFCALCFIAGWNTLGWILVCVAFFFVIIGYIGISKDKEKAKEQEEKRKQKEIEKQAEIDKKTPIYNSEKEKLVEKYGNPDKTIILEELDLSKEIMAFGSAKRIWLLGRDLPMSDIISCTFSDNKQIIKGNISYETKTNTGNMAKRAIVGGALLGGTGAVIGGATAKKGTTVKQEDDKIVHDYTVIININNLSEPVIRIPLGQDGSTVNEIVGLMNVIINRNK